jgi:hypothetical protein
MPKLAGFLKLKGFLTLDVANLFVVWTTIPGLKAAFVTVTGIRNDVTIGLKSVDNASRIPANTAKTCHCATAFKAPSRVGQDQNCKESNDPKHLHFGLDLSWKWSRETWSFSSGTFSAPVAKKIMSVILRSWTDLGGEVLGSLAPGDRCCSQSWPVPTRCGRWSKLQRQAIGLHLGKKPYHLKKKLDASPDTISQLLK